MPQRMTHYYIVGNALGRNAILITESKIKLIRYLLIAYSLVFTVHIIYTVEEYKKLRQNN